MRVLHVFPRFRPDFAGDGLYFEKLWPALIARGGSHDVMVTTTLAPHELPKVVPPGMSLIYIRRTADEKLHKVLLRYYWWLLRNIGRYDAIHVRTHIDRFFGSNFIAWLSGTGFVYSATLDDSPPYILQTYRAGFWPFVRWAMRRTIARLVVLNRRLEDESTPFVQPGRVVVVPQGVIEPKPSGKSRDDLRDEFGIPRDAIVQLYVGSVSRRKDVLFLIENFAELAKDGRNRRLVILGPALEADYSAEISPVIDALGIRDKLVFVPYRDDPSPLYRLADMFVFASWIEGFPNVLAEAMAHGLPIVARRLEGVTDFVLADGETGLLFDDDAEYQKRVRQLEDDKAFATRLGDAARAKATSDYSLPAVASRYDALYRGLSRG